APPARNERCQGRHRSRARHVLFDRSRRQVGHHQEEHGRPLQEPPDTSPPQDRRLKPSRKAVVYCHPGLPMRWISYLFVAVLAAAAPANWTDHKNPKGFALKHPPGWVVETPEKDMVVVHDPTGGIQ